MRRKDSLRGAETAEISVRLGNYSASHFEGSANSGSDPLQELVGQFVAELFKHTADMPTDEAHREALQAFCDTLIPWVEPLDAPPNSSGVFTLFENFQVGEEDTVSIAFTLEGVAFFRAWLRSRGLDPALWSS